MRRAVGLFLVIGSIALEGREELAAQSLFVHGDANESSSIWPGEGNINVDPLFCGGWEAPEGMKSGRTEGRNDSR